mgnify:CR=1 FL=1
MIIGETYSPEVIRDIIRSSYDEIKDDSDPEFCDFMPRMDGAKYYAGSANGELVGVAGYRYREDGTIYHPVVKPEHRGKYAAVFVSMTLAESEGTIYTEIADCYPKVIKFAEKFGFEVIGRSKSCFKGGEEYAVNTMRLIRWAL